MNRACGDRGTTVLPRSRVVLLHDQRWPQVPGVCCWRHCVREAFASVGAHVDELSFQPQMVAARPGAAGRSVPRLAWLPQLIRQPLVRVYRASRRRIQGLAQRTSGTVVRAREVWHRPTLQALARLDGATLVIAESLECAQAALTAHVPAQRVWALALPADRLHLGASSDYAARLAAVAPNLGGFLTDSELARESVERATAASRVRVEIFAPLAVDWPCPSCTASVLQDEYADGPGDFPEVTQLGQWRSMIERLRAGSVIEERYSFLAARLRGLSGGWTSGQRFDWTQDANRSFWRGPEGFSPGEWSRDVQVRAARGVLDAVTPRSPVTPRTSRATLVSGFDLKFVRELGARLNSRTDLDVTLDEWPTLGKGTARTGPLVEGADSILAEWARPSAVWLSRRKRPDQLLVVRLHRYELDRPYPHEIDIDNVDAVVYVSPPIGRRIRAELGWPADKLVYIPNFVDMDWLDRPKLPDARFGIGFVGMEFANKRFDLALDVLTEVRRHEPRFILFVRSVMPWDNKYAWLRTEEREYVGSCFERIDQDPLLRGAVIFDPPGRDMARWYRRVGHVLSMSDIESFHLAAAEGMASGAVPVIRPWPGSAEIYDKAWIHSSVEAAAAAVLANGDADSWAERAARAKAEIRRTADPVAVVQAWADLLHGDVTRARSYFAAHSSTS